MDASSNMPSFVSANASTYTFEIVSSPIYLFNKKEVSKEAGEVLHKIHDARRSVLAIKCDMERHPIENEIANERIIRHMHLTIRYDMNIIADVDQVKEAYYEDRDRFYEAMIDMYNDFLSDNMEKLQLLHKDMDFTVLHLQLCDIISNTKNASKVESTAKITSTQST